MSRSPRNRRREEPSRRHKRDREDSRSPERAHRRREGSRERHARHERSHREDSHGYDRGREDRSRHERHRRDYRCVDHPPHHRFAHQGGPQTLCLRRCVLSPRLPAAPSATISEPGQAAHPSSCRRARQSRARCTARPCAMSAPSASLLSCRATGGTAWCTTARCRRTSRSAARTRTRPRSRPWSSLRRSAARCGGGTPPAALRSMHACSWGALSPACGGHSACMVQPACEQRSLAALLALVRAMDTPGMLTSPACACDGHSWWHADAGGLHAWGARSGQR